MEEKDYGVIMGNIEISVFFGLNSTDFERHLG